MRVEKLLMNSPEIKRRTVGGHLIRAIYAPGGLADRLRDARRHNTMDRSIPGFAGRPPMNDDGSRTYYLVEVARPPSCPRCFCKEGGDGVVVVDCATVDCHCECHGPDMSEWQRPADEDGTDVVYRGERRTQGRYLGWKNPVMKTRTYTVITKNKERLPCREDVRRIGQVRDWGWSVSESARERLALDLLCDALRNEKLALSLYERFAETFISILAKDGWELSRQHIIKAAWRVVQDL